jgi:outer membrane protein TolC
MNWNTGLAAGEVPKPADDVALSHWWSVFGDAELTSLEERALRANLDLRRAVAEIQQARANRDYNAADLFPSVSGGGSRGHSGGVVRARPLNASGGEWRGWEPEVNGGPKFSL